MEAKPNLFQTVLGAFLLQENTYAGMRDDAQRIKRALVLVVAVGLLVGVTGACGRLGEWAVSPPMDKVPVCCPEPPHADALVHRHEQQP